MTTNALITGWGMYAPSRVMTNDDLAKLVDTNDEWIVTRTGIRERRIAADDETTTTLSVNAARDALAVAGLDPAELDLVIVATCTPDYPLPATSVLVSVERSSAIAAKVMITSPMSTTMREMPCCLVFMCRPRWC